MLQISLLCMYHLNHPLRTQQRIIVFFCVLNSRNSQTTEGTSTSKILQEKSSRNLTLEFNRNYVCIWIIWEIDVFFFLLCFRKIFNRACCVLAFLKLFWLWLVKTTITNHQYPKTEKLGAQKRISGNFEKKRFFWFCAKIIADTRFWGASLEKKWKMQSKKFVFGTGDMNPFMWKITKHPWKLWNSSLYTQKFLNFFCNNFSTLWVLADNFHAEWIFLKCLYIFPQDFEHTCCFFWLHRFFVFSPVWCLRRRHKFIANTSKYTRWKILSY